MRKTGFFLHYDFEDGTVQFEKLKKYIQHVHLCIYD